MTSSGGRFLGLYQPLLNKTAAAFLELHHFCTSNGTRARSSKLSDSFDFPDAGNFTLNPNFTVSPRRPPTPEWLQKSVRYFSFVFLHFQMICVKSVYLWCVVVGVCIFTDAQNVTENEIRPYEFTFNIVDFQHRSEKKGLPYTFFGNIFLINPRNYNIFQIDLDWDIFKHNLILFSI